MSNAWVTCPLNWDNFAKAMLIPDIVSGTVVLEMKGDLFMKVAV